MNVIIRNHNATRRFIKCGLIKSGKTEDNVTQSEQYVVNSYHTEYVHLDVFELRSLAVLNFHYTNRRTTSEMFCWIFIEEIFDEFISQRQPQKQFISAKYGT